MLSVAGTLVRIRQKTLADVTRDYDWQTDAELARLDACLPLPMGFREYSLEYERTLHLQSPRRRMYAVETLDGEHIGNCVYHENETVGEVTEIGIMIGERSYWNQGYGTDTVSILVRHIFENTDYDRIVLKTLTWNERAQKCFAHCGFREYGRGMVDGYDFVFMRLTRRDWAAANPATG